MSLIRKDFIERLIEQFAQVLARALNLGRAGQHEQAQQELEAGAQQLLGVGLGALSMLDASSAASLLETGPRIKMFAGFVLQSAKLSELKGDSSQAAARHRQALEVYLEAAMRLPDDEEINQAIRKLEERLAQS